MLDITYLYPGEPYEPGTVRVFPSFPTPVVIKHVEDIISRSGLVWLNHSVILYGGYQTLVDEVPQLGVGVDVADLNIVCRNVGPYDLLQAVVELKDIRFFDGKWRLQVERESFKGDKVWLRLALTSKPSGLIVHHNMNNRAIPNTPTYVQPNGIFTPRSHPDQS